MTIKLLIKDGKLVVKDGKLIYIDTENPNPCECCEPIVFDCCGNWETPPINLFGKLADVFGSECAEGAEIIFSGGICIGGTSISWANTGTSGAVRIVCDEAGFRLVFLCAFVEIASFPIVVTQANPLIAYADVTGIPDTCDGSYCDGDYRLWIAENAIDLP